MKNEFRKKLRLAMPLLVAAAFAGQTALDYSSTGEISSVYLGSVVLGLATFLLFWWIELPK